MVGGVRLWGVVVSCACLVLVGGVVMGHCLGGWWWALIAVRVNALLLHSIVVMVMVACHCCLSIIVMLHWVEIG